MDWKYELTMYSRKIVPTDFIVPEKIEKSEFILKPLTVRDIVKDYDAVMSSVDHLKGLMDDSGWPEGLTIEENLIDPKKYVILGLRGGLYDPDDLTWALSLIHI